MKALAFLMASLIAHAALADNNSCADVAGTWQSGTSNPWTFICNQTSFSNFSCAVTFYQFNTRCSVAYNGHFDTSTGLFPYAETYVSGTCPHQWSGTIYVENYNNQPCGSIQDTGLSSGQIPRIGVEVPGSPGGNVSNSAHGENASIFVGWYGANKTSALFTAKLNDSHDPTFNFSGRTVTEVVNLVSDECLGTITNENITSGGSWTPDEDNNYSVGWDGTYAPDSIGFNDNLDGWSYIVATERTYSVSLPCSITTSQTMLINDVNNISGWAVYETHNNLITIHDGYLYFYRNGTAAYTPWGSTRQNWKWWDDMTWYLSGGFL